MSHSSTSIIALCFCLFRRIRSDSSCCLDMVRGLPLELAILGKLCFLSPTRTGRWKIPPNEVPFSLSLSIISWAPFKGACCRSSSTVKSSWSGDLNDKWLLGFTWVSGFDFKTPWLFLCLILSDKDNDDCLFASENLPDASLACFISLPLSESETDTLTCTVFSTFSLQATSWHWSTSEAFVCPSFSDDSISHFWKISANRTITLGFMACDPYKISSILRERTDVQISWLHRERNRSRLWTQSAVERSLSNLISVAKKGTSKVFFFLNGRSLKHLFLLTFFTMKCN